ncbi:hypothetical protein TcWFU_004305 [Taenia crassiceps]|uniref:EF-hand domain-containing protein n=1 Tax=Taenia crassiceps TaxID=6207 RepID=A0ABR4QH88_9CEST
MSLKDRRHEALSLRRIGENFATMAENIIIDSFLSHTHLVMPIGKKNETSDKMLTFVPDFEIPSEAGTYAEQSHTTIQRHFFNKDGLGKLIYKDFLRFILGLQTEVLRAEFYHFSCGRDSISPLQLAQIVLRYAELPEKMKRRGLEHVAESIMFEEDSIDFESFCSFFNLLFQYEDLYSALKMFMLSGRAISKEEFQRAARAVIGKRLNDVIVNTIFLLFDADGDGHLSAEEFISVMRSYLSRGTRGQLTKESNMQSFTSCVGTRMRANPAFQFAYWPRYVARLLRFRPVFRGDLQGWSFEMDRSMPFELPDAKPHEYAEEKWLPVWRFSEQSPWDIANRLSTFPYRTDWCVVHPDGKRTRERLTGMTPEEQTIFKGDRVIVLKGISKGKIGIVSSVIKMRNLVYVEGLNLRYRSPEGTGPLISSENYLEINKEVALIDPSDKTPCEAVWRYNSQGKRIRVSKRSGYPLPLPTAARILDDLTDPVTAEVGEKDTPTEAVSKTTVDFVSPQRLETFEEELTRVYAPEERRQRMPTFWY